jgi:hypothetical protein
MHPRALLLGLILALAARVAGAEVIEIGSLSLDWPTGTVVKSNGPPVELAGPGGAKVLVTLMRLGSGAGKAPADFDKLLASNEKILSDLAQRSGRVALPLGREALPDGSALVFVGSEKAQLFGSGYFLQYAVLSRNGQLGYFSFEGRGQAQAQHDLVKGIFRSARWADDAGSEAERAAFTERVAALLRAELGGASVVIAEPLTLKLDTLQANLGRVYAFCRSNVQACGAELDRYVHAVKELYGETEVPVTPEALRVVVRTADYVEPVRRDAQQAATPEKAKESEPLPQAFVDGLLALPVLDAPSLLRYLSRGDAQKLGLSPEQAHALGLARLRAAQKPLGEVAKPVAAGRIGTLAGDSYASSRVLFPADWAPLARAQAGVLVVALPTTDTLLYGADASAAGLDALRTLAEELGRRAPNRLSALLLRWTESGWELVR